MIELAHDTLIFRFPEIHPDAVLSVEFQRTLRVPDDDSEYPLPAGLGRFPLEHVDDFADRVPAKWIERGGVMLPMYQSEAMWIRFKAQYPFAIKVAAGKINAVTGENWRDGLNHDPQDYVVGSTQPWLDGFCVDKGVIRQFVAMPLGSGYSVEEQVTGTAEFGGIQILAHPMKREAYERRGLGRRRRPVAPEPAYDAGEEYDQLDGDEFSPSMSRAEPASMHLASTGRSAPSMGLGSGGRMRQQIYDDPYGLDEWDLRTGSRCYVHLANSLVWRDVTGKEPPQTPLTAREYRRYGVPWFDYYDDAQTTVDGSSVLNEVKSVSAMANEQGDVPLPDNESIVVDETIALRKGLRRGQVREGSF